VRPSLQIKGRKGKQCRERWQNQLDPTVKKGPWSEEEDEILIAAQKKHGNKWVDIAKVRALPSRLALQMRSGLDAGGSVRRSLRGARITLSRTTGTRTRCKSSCVRCAGRSTSQTRFTRRSPEELAVEAEGGAGERGRRRSERHGSMTSIPPHTLSSAPYLGSDTDG